MKKLAIAISFAFSLLSCTPNSNHKELASKPSDMSKVSSEVPDSIKARISKIHNSQLQWDGSDLGLLPKIENPESASLINVKADVDPLLKDRLKDADAFAIAHVILTFRKNQGFESSGDQWNGLRVQLGLNGKVSYFEEDQSQLIDQWIEE